jgi:hypothetical protein
VTGIWRVEHTAKVVATPFLDAIVQVNSRNTAQRVERSQWARVRLLRA